MKILAKAFVVSLLLACGLAIAPQAEPLQQTPPAAPKPKPGPDDWPDAKTMADKKADAETRKLFQGTEPVPFTLTADFKAVQKDRNPTSTKLFPATIEFTKEDGSIMKAPMQIRTRGHVRRMYETCQFAPLRLEFPREQMKGTIFDGIKNIKLGTHCRDVGEFEQYVLREYAAYRIFNLLTPKSFRARLAKVTYVNASDNKKMGTKYGIFIEDNDDVARRMTGRVSDQMKARFVQLDQDTLTLFTMFETLIGNTDMSIYAQHNVIIVATPEHINYPVPYDFDYSGLVNAAYAVPVAALGIGTVRERLYRGPCKAQQEYDTFLTKFREIKAEIPKIYDSLPDFNPGYKTNVLNYVNQFYTRIDKPDDLKKLFLDKCLKDGVM